MSCSICGKGACASWMHSAEEQAEWDEVNEMSEMQLKAQVISLRRENQDYTSEIEKLQKEIEALKIKSESKGTEVTCKD